MTEWIKARDVLSRAGMLPTEYLHRSPLGDAVLRRVKAGRAKMRAGAYTIDGLPSRLTAVSSSFFGKMHPRCDWVAGDFTSFVNGRDHEATDAEFAIEDIADLVAAHHVAPTQAGASNNLSDKKDRGGNSLSSKWPSFLAELVLWLYVEDNEIEGLRAAELHRIISDRMAKKGINEIPISTVRPSLTAVLVAIVEAKTAA